MTSENYRRLLAWAREHGRAFSTKEVCELLGVEWPRAHGLVNAAHNNKAVRRVARRGAMWISAEVQHG